MSVSQSFRVTVQTVPDTNVAPTFPSATTTRSVGEHATSGSDVGSAVAAMDRNNDPLTYILGGTDAASFDIDSSTGQLRTNRALDYETQSTYTVTVSVRDSKDDDGNPDTATDDTITVTISVTNQDDPGEARLSWTSISVGSTVSASLTDGDGGITNQSWQWQRIGNVNIGDGSDSYTLTSDDSGRSVRATVQYDDAHGQSKSATSPWSPVVTEDPPDPPTMLTVTTSDGEVQLDWKSASGATSYNIQVTPVIGSPVISQAGTSATITGLLNLTTYRFGVQARNSHGPSAYTYRSVPLPLATPGGFDVIPLPRRKAEFKWELPTANPTGTQYELQIQRQNGTWKPSAMRIQPGSTKTLEIDLDKIILDEGLADSEGYDIRLSATKDATTEFSDEYRIVDSPITSINGNNNFLFGRPPLGSAVVKWSAPSHATEYMLRWRSLGTDHFGHNHSSLLWRLDDTSLQRTFLNERTISSGSQQQLSVPLLQLNTIYAFQLNYKIDNRGKTMQVFSTRDAYVLPAVEPVGNGERVATFPLNNPLPNKEYAYVFCDDTFPTNSSTWKAFVEHAFNQWEIGTDGLVTLDPLPATDCADYTAFVEQVRDDVIHFIDTHRPEGLPPTQDAIVAQLGAFFRNLDSAGIEATRTKDHQLNEVYMIQDTGVNEILVRNEIFDEISNGVGHGYCAYACAYKSPADGNVTVDIKLSRRSFERDNLVFPGGNQSSDRDDVSFNACGSVPNSYGVLVHEAGHALGIGYGSDGTDQDQHHPLIYDSVMSYALASAVGYKYSCSVHPLDVMAIYALYQTIR